VKLCHQVSNFHRIILFHSQSQAVKVCLLLQCFTLWRGSPVLQNIRNYLHNYSVASRKIWCFIHTTMWSSNLASLLALTSCYQSYVRFNMIIQSISAWYCLNMQSYVHTVFFVCYHFFCYVYDLFSYSSAWIGWPGHKSNHLLPSVLIINECSDTQLLLSDFMMCTGPTLPFEFQQTTE